METREIDQINLFWKETIPNSTHWVVDFGLQHILKSVTRDLYEEATIQMHLAKKRLIHLPVEYQEELDLLALRSRRENKQVWSLQVKNKTSFRFKGS